MSNYNGLILSNKKVEEKNIYYDLDVTGNCIKISTKEQTKIERITDFFARLRINANLIYIEKNILHVRIGNGNGYINEIYALTPKAYASDIIKEEILFAIEKTKGTNNDYELEVIGDKYAKSLRDVIYGKKSLSSFCNESNKEEIKKLYTAKKDLIKEFFLDTKDENKINAMGLGIFTIIGLMGIFLGDFHTLAMPPLCFITVCSTHLGYAITKKIKINRILKTKIEQVLEQPKTPTIESSSQELISDKQKSLEKEDFLEKEDGYTQAIIGEIKTYIIKINEEQYDGYQEHLQQLYNLANLYFQNRAKYIETSFFSDDARAFISDLNRLEENIDEQIKSYSQNQKSHEILEGLIDASGINVEDLIVMYENDLEKSEEKPEVEKTGEKKLVFAPPSEKVSPKKIKN